MKFIKLLLCVFAVLFFVLLISGIINFVWYPTIYNFKYTVVMFILYFIIGGLAKEAIKDD